MSRRIADLMIKIGAENYEFLQKSKQVERNMASLQQSLNKVGKQLSLRLTAPLAALGAVSLKNYDTQARAEAKVEQAIRSTGGAAKLSAEELKKYASELQNKSLFGDEKILNDVTAQLLTFTNIAGENFKRTQQAVMDVATVLDGDLKSASIQLGKALNDPVANLSALSRSGIQFSKDQKAVIKSLAETNRLAEAQSIILGEIEKQYGGQAQKAAQTGLGALKQLKNQIGDLMEEVGKIMQPVVLKVTAALKQMVTALQNLSPEAKKFAVAIGTVVAAIGPLSLAVSGGIRVFGMLKTAFSAVGRMGKILGTALKTVPGPLGLILKVVGLLVPALALLRSRKSGLVQVTGEHQKAVADEARKVNELVSKINNANTKEAERKKLITELKRIQPELVAGLNDEADATKVLTKNAAEYNRELVKTMAMAAKRDEVTAALQRRDDLDRKRADSQHEFEKYMSDLQVSLYSGKIEVGEKHPTQGITRWRQITEKERGKLIAAYSDIVSSAEDWQTKLDRIYKLFAKPIAGYDKMRGLGVKKSLLSQAADIDELDREYRDIQNQVDRAAASVVEFARAFNIEMNPADGSQDAVQAAAEAAVLADAAQKAAEEAARAAETSAALAQTKRDNAKTAEELAAADNAEGEARLLAQRADEAAQLAEGMKKAAEQAAKVAEAGKKPTAELGTGLAVATGYIEKLNAEIKKLEDRKKLLPEGAFEQMAQLNRQIEELTQKRDAFLNTKVRTPHVPVLTVAPKIQVRYAGGLSLSPDFMQKLKGGMDILNKTVTEAVQEMSYLKVSPKFEVDLPKKGVFKPIEDRLWEEIKDANDKMKSLKERAEKLAEFASDILSQACADAFSGIGEAIGNAISGSGLGEGMKSVNEAYAMFFTNLGKLAIQVGTMMEAFKKAMEKLIANPWLMIAAGVAMVALGAALRNKIERQAESSVPKLASGGLAFAPTYAMIGDNRNAGVDPEVIAPLSKLRNYLQPAGLGGEVKFRIEGDTLVGILNRMNKQNDRF